MKDSAPAGLSALYDKIDGIEPRVAEALVRETATHIKQILKHVPHHRPEMIPGYNSKIVDGNKIEATDRRLKVLREQEAAPLPGFALVVYEPVHRVISHAILCEDGHAQERSLFHRITPLVQVDDLWFADRNFCCFRLLSGISQRGGFFVIRQHKSSIRWVPTSELEFCGASATGDVWEQKGVVEYPETKERLPIRRVEVRLKEPTRDGDTTLSLFSNLPEAVSAILIADSYHGRWRIETAFQEMKALLEGEINTLSYPRAALFALCVSYVSYNILQCMVSAIEASHPEESRAISPYYVADEVSSMFRGLDKLTDSSDWEPFSTFTPIQTGEALLRLGRLTDFGEYAKRPPPKKNLSANRRNESIMCQLINC
jgi:hypothetical protein